MAIVLTAKDPVRYHEEWRQPFYDLCHRHLTPGAKVLDVGSGRHSVLPPAIRPRDVTYVGLDVSEDELSRAPSGSYGSTVVHDAAEPHAQLVNEFDLIVSWQVLEHVKRLENVLDNFRDWLVPGGAVVAQLSGGLAVHSLINRVVPHTFAVSAMERLVKRPPDSVFVARYNGCYAKRLRRMLEGWDEIEIIPRYRGGDYFEFSPRLRKIYLRYENWIAGRRFENLATHYLVYARRP